MMWDPVRRYAAGVFLLCIALVFVFAFAIEIDVLVIVFAVMTYLAYACESRRCSAMLRWLKAM